MGILQIIRLVLSVGTPPEINDEADFRNWCKRVAEAAAQLATLTNSELDDQIVAGLGKITATDAYWAAFYAILKAAANYLRDDDQDQIVRSDSRTAELGEKAGIDPATIIAIIGLVLKFIEWRRNR